MHEHGIELAWQRRSAVECHLRAAKRRRPGSQSRRSTLVRESPTLAECARAPVELTAEFAVAAAAVGSAETGFAEAESVEAAGALPAQRAFGSNRH